MTVHWERVTLREALTALSRAQRVAIVVDRRLDPDQLVTLDARQEPLELVLTRLAQSCGAGYSRLRQVIYLGPTDTADKLRTVAALTQVPLATLPITVRGSLTRNRDASWASLAEPRRLLRDLGREAGVEWSELEAAIPHDLWNQADLPELPWHERVLLITIQFDYSFELRNGFKQAVLVPIGPQPRLEKSYPAGKDALATLAKFRELVREGELRVSGDKIVVRARIEDHERLLPPKPSVGSGKTPSRGETEVYSLTLSEVPLEKLLESLAQRLELTWVMDRPALAQAGIRLDQRVSLQVDQQPLDALLTAALQPAGLQFRRQGKTVTITPARKP